MEPLVATTGGITTFAIKQSLITTGKTIAAQAASQTGKQAIVEITESAAIQLAMQSGSQAAG